VTPAYLGADKDGYVDLLKKAGLRAAASTACGSGSGTAACRTSCGARRRPQPWDVRDEVRALARRYARWTSAPAHRSLGERTRLRLLRDEGWLDLNSSYTYGPVAWRILADREVSPPRPRS